MGYIKDLWQQHGVKIVAGGLISSMVASFVACDTPNNNEITTDKYDAVQTESGTNWWETETTYQPPVDTVEHSQLYYRAKNKWGQYWNDNPGTTWDFVGSQESLRCSGLPFEFLEQQGVICYDEYGLPYAACNPNFEFAHPISANIYIDPVQEGDIYALVQYADGDITDGESNSGISVTTWMLKYTIDQDVYQDLLLLHGDGRARLLFQEIDEEYTPEVISKSVIDYKLIDKLNVFDQDDLFSVIYRGHGGPTNYIESIDYNTMTLTINYSPCKANSKKYDEYNREHAGEIYSYTVKLTDTDAWDKVLVGSNRYSPITEEERSQLTIKDMMPTKEVLTGICLIGFKVGYFNGAATDEQKASATLKYNFVPVVLPVNVVNTEKVNQYNSGKIDYEDVNELTKAYVEQYGYSK